MNLDCFYFEAAEKTYEAELDTLAKKINRRIALRKRGPSGCGKIPNSARWRAWGQMIQYTAKTTARSRPVGSRSATGCSMPENHPSPWRT